MAIDTTSYHSYVASSYLLKSVEAHCQTLEPIAVIKPNWGLYRRDASKHIVELSLVNQYRTINFPFKAYVIDCTDTIGFDNMQI